MDQLRINFNEKKEESFFIDLKQMIVEQKNNMFGDGNDVLSFLENTEDFIISIINDLIKETKKSFNKYCRNCGKYFNSDKDKFLEEEYETLICTYSDAGYGDDDEYAPVKYRETYQRCPYCQEKVIIEKNEIWRGKSKSRWS